MGDLEEDVVQLTAEPDGEDEGPEGVHPPSLTQTTPWIFMKSYTLVTWFIASNGWFCVALCIVALIFWKKFGPQIKKWKQKREEDKEAAEYHKNPDLVLAREQAIEAARRRMQEEYDQKAKEYKQKQIEHEEKKRLEKVAEWDRHQRGEGYHSKIKAPSEDSLPGASGSAAGNKQSGKPRLRPVLPFQNIIP